MENNSLIFLDDVSFNGFFELPVTDEIDKILVDIERVKLAMKCLENCKHTTYSFNREITSYGLKHLVEKYLPECYLSNGELITAMYNVGFNYEKVSERSPNCFFDISAQSVRDLQNNTYGFKTYK